MNAKVISSQKGFGIINGIILIAVIFAAVNIYAYFNPGFSLSRYSLLGFVRSQRDEIKKKDIKSLQAAIDKYYQENNNFPGAVSTCGRISSTVYHPEVRTSLQKYFPESQFPQDPNFATTNKDYFYAHTETGYILMAVLEAVPPIPDDQKENFNFKGCYDWPGDNIYNYRIDGTT